MLLAGDELGRTQGGNNNAYCQDSEISWSDWELDPNQREFMDFVARLIAFRRSHAIFSRRHFLTGLPWQARPPRTSPGLRPPARK